MKKIVAILHYLLLLFILFTATSNSVFASCPCGATTCECYNASGRLVGSVAENCNYADCPWIKADCRVYDSTAAGDCNAQISACNNNCSASCGSCQSAPPSCNHQCFMNCLDSDCNNCGQNMGGCGACDAACNGGCGGGCLVSQEKDISLSPKHDEMNHNKHKE